MTTLTTDQLASTLLSRTYEEWCGLSGYSSVPMIRREDGGWYRLPVAAEYGYADGRPTEYVDADPDLLKEVLDSLPIGKEIEQYEYYGCHWEGTHVWRKVATDLWEEEWHEPSSFSGVQDPDAEQIGYGV